jgi:hypothetical protein
MVTRNPVKQVVFVDIAGGLRYASVTSPQIPSGAITTDFQYTPGVGAADGRLTFKNEGWIACQVGGVESTTYKIYAEAGSTHGDACVGIALGTIPYDGATAYQYDV